MACDSFGVNSHSVLSLPPFFSFPLSISQRGSDISIGTNRRNCKQVHSRNHCRLSCHNPILVIQTQTPRYCCGLSRFSVIMTVISHLCQELILYKSLGSLTHVRGFGWNQNLSGALNCRFLFQHRCLNSNIPLSTAVMTVRDKLAEKQKTRPLITIMWKSHLVKDLWSAHFRGDLKNREIE